MMGDIFEKKSDRKKPKIYLSRAQDWRRKPNPILQVGFVYFRAISINDFRGNIHCSLASPIQKFLTPP